MNEKEDDLQIYSDKVYLPYGTAAGYPRSNYAAGGHIM